MPKVDGMKAVSATPLPNDDSLLVVSRSDARGFIGHSVVVPRAVFKNTSDADAYFTRQAGSTHHGGHDKRWHRMAHVGEYLAVDSKNTIHNHGHRLAVPGRAVSMPNGNYDAVSQLVYVGVPIHRTTTAGRLPYGCERLETQVWSDAIQECITNALNAASDSGAEAIVMPIIGCTSWWQNQGCRSNLHGCG